jgi:hypothetical protein
MTIILAAYSLFFHELLTPAILFTTLILVDTQTTCINVSVICDHTGISPIRTRWLTSCLFVHTLVVTCFHYRYQRNAGFGGQDQRVSG